MSKICIIPARGGSKRIKNKNIKLFLGKPIIEYSIRTALESKIFDEVMVSTDCSNIAKISVKLGAKVPFMRSKINSDDYSTTLDVVNEVVKEYKKVNKNFSYICCLYPTAPFVNKDLLKEALKLLTLSKTDLVFPIIKFSYPIQRALTYNIQNSRVQFLNERYKNSRSQDLKEFFHDSGQFYFFTSKKISQKHASIIDNNSCGIVIDEIDAQDIDNISDWKLAELKFKTKM